jgi:hypothetical protein
MSDTILNLITGLLSFFFTIAILSYLIGDNPLFKLSIHIFVGVSAGYAAAATWHSILKPKLIEPLLIGNNQQRLLLVVPLVLCVLLLTKLSPRAARLGNPAMAFLVGTGAAVTILGAVYGTLIPQTVASINLFGIGTGSLFFERLFEGLIFLVGTICTLAYFHFGARPAPSGPRRSKLVVGMAWVGKIFIVITLAVLFAGAYVAALTAMIERINSLWVFLRSLL